jgi:hypothetical protein
MNNTKIVVNCTTGVTSYLPLSAKEIAEREEAVAKLIASETSTDEEASTLIV